MKNYFVFISYVFFLSLNLVSCSLDPEVMIELTEDQAQSQYTYSRGRVASIYSDVKSGFLNIGGAMLASASDEAEHTVESSMVHYFNRGSWDEFINPDDVWGGYYRGIRKANQFLATSDNINLDQWKNDPTMQGTYENYLVETRLWKSEVRFLRAYFYFELIKRYGGVPLIKNVLSMDDAFDNVPRNSLAECIQFIVTECDAAVEQLPARYSDADLGKVTKVAVLALKSRVLLYAASELFSNPGWASGYSNPEFISLTGDRQVRWQAAANAALAAIDTCEKYNYVLSSNYRTLFGSSAHTQAGVIFFRREGGSNAFESANYSVGFDLGNSGTTPTQNLVDAYEMNDGSKFDWNNPEHAANPYANRDPRLNLTIITNNSTYKGRPVECWTGGRDGPPIVLTSKTGYYLKKYVDENLNLLAGQTSGHSWVIFRLAELYLNYAEALNEADPGNSDIKTYVDRVRGRGGINMPGLPSGLDQPQMRERIYQERRIEFAFEDHRFWDVRRWMTASSVLSASIKGVKISKIADDQFNYNVVEVESRVFSPKMYFYPIPQNEIFINGKLVQNPLW